MAYGARLESVLGESPRGFESPILRDVMSHNVVDFYEISRDPSYAGFSRGDCLFSGLVGASSFAGFVGAVDSVKQ